MPTRDLLERTHLFALAVLKFCRRLPGTPEAQEAAAQLRRAANSVRSNYRAARRGRSRADLRKGGQDGARQYNPSKEPPKQLNRISRTSIHFR
ncbi:MAG: four helix bundle protein [Acidobacteria bacterium]|nr:four helix bundle protein [Acidobacteriota bacterium]